MSNPEKVWLGTAYYPEQWSEKLWAEDFQRMAELGLSVVRMAEFAWAVFEPTEGVFSFELFDRALDLADSHHLRVVLGTPTATPPAWLTHRYPEILNVRRDGVAYQHGQRRHYNYNAPIYQELAARIVRQMVDHYGAHPAVIGWQIDNEINCEVNVFYSDADHRAFRRWLKQRYGSLDALNAAWGTVFWSQTYTDWEQVSLTRVTVSDSPNPHQVLDEKRFISDSAIQFVEAQARIIRQGAPHHFVTTNGLFGHLDNHQMTREALDWLSYDSYPNFSTIWPDSELSDSGGRAWGRHLSVVRDISSNFWVMEQQAGAGGWVNRMEAPSPHPGQLRLWTYQSIAHGANAVLYFRWRTATAGTEIYWHGLNDYGNQPNRRLREAERVAQELKALPDALTHSQFVAEVAILDDYDNEWDGEFDRWVGPLAVRSKAAWYAALQHRHIPVNWKFLNADATLDEIRGYRLLIYPHPAIMTERTATLLTEYVEQGGTLILGCRSGYKDPSGQCYPMPFPGVLAPLTGIAVDDFTWIGGTRSAPRLDWYGAADGRDLLAEGFNEALRPTRDSVEILAGYADGDFAGSAVAIRRAVGHGAVYYYGAAFSQAVCHQLIDQIGVVSPSHQRLHLPAGVELSIRQTPDGSQDFWFLLNYSSEVQTVAVLTPAHDLLRNQPVHGVVRLGPFDVALLSNWANTGR